VGFYELDESSNYGKEAFNGWQEKLSPEESRLKVQKVRCEATN